MNNSRRSFLGKLVSGFASLFIGTKVGFSFSKLNKMKSTVSNIEPLGFQWKTLDPFLFCVHHEDFFPKGNGNYGPDKNELQGRNIGQDFVIKDGWRMYHGQSVPGFPGHPHRGFETVTVVRKGIVDHSDSMGASGRYGNGDVQWMTAGKGVQHAEMFPLIHTDKENPMELFQIWLNLPKANKFVEPHFKMLWAETIPIINHTDSRGKKISIEVIAGTHGKQIAPQPTPNSWAANKNNNVAIWNIEMQAGATYLLPAAEEGVNRTLYFYKGSKLTVDGVEVDYYHMATLKSAGKIELKNGNKIGKVLVLQGKPINEPVVQYGPFVMNSKQEIQQAFNDYQKTNFGGWPWPQNDPVHSNKGRFAKHANGTIEKPNEQG